MSKNKILMCPPDYFSVDYVINPWMSGLSEPPDICLLYTSDAADEP